MTELNNETANDFSMEKFVPCLECTGRIIETVMYALDPITKLVVVSFRLQSR